MRFFYLALFIFLISCNPTKKDEIKNPNLIDYTLQRSFPHDKNTFIQGLVIHNGQLYESTGQENSWIGIVDIATGIPDKKVVLDKQYFGEGITILNNKIYQLTWEHRKGFVYDLTTFEKIKEFEYASEGWGITHDNSQLIMSDGTSKLYFLDTVNLTVTKTMEVVYENKPLNALNELEYVNGYIYANVWQTNYIAKISPSTGEAVGFLDLSPLAKQAELLNSRSDVLNGIAWHEGTKSLLVTGKYWPFIYVLKLKEQS